MFNSITVIDSQSLQSSNFLEIWKGKEKLNLGIGSVL